MIPTISILLLAAGSSSRMGKTNKLLLPYNNTSIIRHICNQILQIPPLQSTELSIEINTEIIVVLGHQADLVQQELENLPVKFTFNPDHLSGMTSSIQAGIQAAHPQTEGWMICLSDLPLIESEEYHLILQAFQQNIKGKAQITQPTFTGKNGHPVCFSKHFKKIILEHKSPNGCKQIIQTNQQHLHPIEMPSSNILRDVDRPEDYEGLV